LAAQFLEVERVLSVSQDEEIALDVENQYLPVELDIETYYDPAGYQ
jgi:hypothetical protein